MAQRLDTRDDTFESDFAALLGAKREEAADVREAVDTILADVRARGDEAVCALTEQFDRLALTPDTIRVSEDELEAAADDVAVDVRAALDLAAQRIEAHHTRQMPKDDSYTDSLGVSLASRWTPIDAVGLYVPGGTASYPSSVLMNAIPAKVAGVERVVMVVPMPDGETNPAVLAAAKRAGVDEVYRIGGAQAIAALAYGTDTIAPVAKIVGPGNAYVAAAKRAVFGTVGIDMIAGPSEVLVIADETANPQWVAADLLAQAEHDEAAQSIVITLDDDLGDAIALAVSAQVVELPRRPIASVSWRDYGAIIRADDREEAVALANRIAAEHLELAVDDPEGMMDGIRHAGAIFLGHHTPEAIGDYVGGSNHVLPTARSARFSSGLSVMDFIKRTSVLSCTPDALAKLGPAAQTLARTEGLTAHARSVAIRSNQA
ncbi:MAG: histidinol dehydrogenase [Rhizobiales bacterium]|nr:histidinol dehydrogenase [Hyphomicrobiales bacterium]MBO6699107.1 histidinol dehydrogenase [Hyphomicrobiales bacterium]MBO6736645.1 histidinol dehydrogenase [Hyphomicrobiales bacterium]MBO6912281.1 histidinol dehydrogenase [Hyphomicrobiales bacterium]MBO6956527.1 histidinol dehydrogenase [Hyphomicrobiales bacterium]